ncbi:hypothetical protein BLI29_07600 [Listeria monocytogenes]|uniref:hypothetical protein n=2 Tax=Listeria ivanovii TaxID=1638 RepID=UPI001819B49F|nr:hypothetical protein [Listeria ivanovii]EAG7618520.1 hypothetical protein [Listeria monocytogenes]EEO3273142.1 hypothetical protein [Listeria monocytogenes]MBM5607442.1 hypothetical protein [Listeria ivanovii]MBM5707652.1 hypothetical protein [Listeria ivanovii]
MRMSVNSEMKRLEFIVGLGYQVFTKELSRSTMLVVEGSKVKGFSEYRYTFYKVYYEKQKEYAKYTKVYMRNESAFNVIRKVEKYLFYLDKHKRKEVNSKLN